MNINKATQYHQLAVSIANIFSKDPNTKVGAVIIAPESYQILTIGYNGMPRGIDENILDRWKSPQKYKFVEHAERNAIYNASRHGTPLYNSIAVISLFPCIDCARALIQSGIKSIITSTIDEKNKKWLDEWILSKKILEEANIDITFISFN